MTQSLTHLFDNWYLPCIIATFLYGFFNFAARISSARGYKAPLTILISTFTVFICAAIAFKFSGKTVVSWEPLIILACSNGFLFSLSSLLSLLCLERIPGSIGFPIKKLNTVFVILLSLFIYGSFPTPKQWAGIGLALFSIMILSINKEKNDKKFVSKGFVSGIIMAVSAALFTAFSALINKKGSMQTDINAFVMVSYFTAFLMSLVFLKINHLHSKKSNQKNLSPQNNTPGTDFNIKKAQLGLGIAMGLTNFIGFILILTAFSMGPLHIIHPIFSSSMVISVILSVIIYKEGMNLKIGIAICAVLAAVILVK